jgi:hypothetical protein
MAHQTFDTVLVLTSVGLILPSSAIAQDEIADFGFASIVEVEAQFKKSQPTYIVTTKQGMYDSVAEVKVALSRLSEQYEFNCSVQEPADAFDF